MGGISWALLLGALVLGAAAGYWARRQGALGALGKAEEERKRKLEEAETRAKEVILEAKEKAAGLLAESKKEETERTAKITALEGRLLEREETLDKKLASIGEEEKKLQAKTADLAAREADIAKLREEAAGKLEKLSGLTREEAKEALLANVRQSNEKELAQMMQTLVTERHDEMEKKAMEIITIALQRYARSHVAEVTTTVFQIENEEMKGKIIGREGRNIRALERATGVEFVMDETPDTILISSFDPYRREVARLALQKLVKDGRIQPAKIEEKVEEAKAEMDKRMTEVGEAAAMEVGIYDLPKEIIRLVGRLHFRTSYGQNVLMHSVEMTYLAASMAAELGLDVEIAKKGALLHDIGKAIDHDVEGTHVDLGMKILKKYEVDEAIIEAMRSHHDDYPYARPEAYVVTAADVLSAARPGARRDNVENYLKRLGDLEKIATDFPGVKQAYAISAGRELRVFVVPEKVDDFGALDMARQIANKIQSELKYPGEIKVNVIREMRAVEYAR